MSDKLDLYAKASKLSLENAQRWINDAELLIGNSSFGHASALLRFAFEELAKAYVCWFTSEKMWPVENKVVRDVFSKHIVKNQVIMGVFYSVAFISTYGKEELIAERPEVSDEEITEAFRPFKDIPVMIEKMRQKAIYVHLNLKKKETETPLTIGRKEATSLLRGGKHLLTIIKIYIEIFPDSSKEILRLIFSSIPKVAWKTGEIPIEWFREK